MKKILGLSLMLSLTLFLITGCNSGTTTTSEENTTNDITESITSTEETTTLEGQKDFVMFDLIGFGETVTGGVGGTVVTASTGSEINEALAAKRVAAKAGSDYPLIILIDGEINLANTTSTYGQSDLALDEILLKDMSNISFIGLGVNASFNGIGIRGSRANNIIIQNLTIHEVLASTASGDCISFESSENIWVDHCELYAEEVDGEIAPTASASIKDKYDGLLDAKAKSDNITYSWNYFHDSYKTSLNGSSDGDTYKRHITYHHNIFEDCNSRLPLFRNGYGHIYNNYYIDIYTSGINSRVTAEILIENNIFENVKNPICSLDSSIIGYWNIRGNVFDNCVGSTEVDAGEIPWSEGMIPTCDYEVPYDYHLDSTTNLIELLRTNAGVGVFNLHEGLIDYSVVDAVILLINSIGEVTLTSNSAITLALNAYNDLTSDEKASVTNYVTLTNAITAYNNLLVQNVSTLINAIGVVDETKLDEITLALDAYNTLSSELKSQVTNYLTLTDAITAYENILVQSVITLINAIGVVDETKLDEINSAQNAYDALSSQLQSQVTNYQTLVDAHISFSEYAVLAVINLINSIGTVTLDSETVIMSARNAYDDLTITEQEDVTNYQILVDAENTYLSLVRVDTCITLINAIGVVDANSGSLISQANTAYGALTLDEKNVVGSSVYQILLDAIEAYQVFADMQKIFNATDFKNEVFPSVNLDANTVMDNIVYNDAFIINGTKNRFNTVSGSVTVNGTAQSYAYALILRDNITSKVQINVTEGMIVTLVFSSIEGIINTNSTATFIQTTTDHVIVESGSFIIYAYEITSDGIFEITRSSGSSVLCGAYIN